MQPSFEGFLRFAVEQPGDIRPGLSWGDFAVYLSRNLERARARFEIELRAYQEETVAGKGGRADDPDRMSENKRITANIAALHLLRQMQAEGRTAPTAKEKTQLWRYSGWGGIDPAKLPLDAEAFPEDYLEAIRQWKRAVSQGQVPTSGLFQGLRHQFFTPLDVCRAMWALAQRAVIGPVDTALEPSVGVGRFLQTTPRGVKPAWTTVEADPLLSELVVAGHPGTWHFTETFEEHYTAWAALPDEERPYYSVVVMNPPYPDRPERDRKLDGRDWGKAHTYFVERASQMLRPGGVLVAITPAGEIVGTDAENHRLREVLLGRCHFVGAAFPPSNVFPGVNPLTNSFAIHAWVRLAAPAPLMEEARRLAAGHYAQLDGHTMGAWVEFGGRKTVKGTFAPDFLETMDLRPMPATQRQEIDAWLEQYGGNVSPKKTSAKPAKTPKIPSKSEVKSARKVDLAAMTRADADAVDTGQALSLRLQRFGALVAQQGAEGARAESGRAELIRDLRTFVARYGNPHQDRGIQEHQRELAPLLTAIDPNGEISSVFLRPVSPYAFSAPPEGASPTELVFWYSRQRGVCTDRDLAQHGYVDAVEGLIENPDVAVEPQADGSLWFYWFKPEIVEFPRTDSVTGDPVLDEHGEAIIDQEVHAPAYLSGNLIPRIERVDAALTEVSDSALRAKLEHQKGQLMLALPSYSIGTIKPTPRSGLIPPECLQDYVNDVLRDRFQITDPQATVAVDQARIKIRVGGPNQRTTLEGSSGQFIQMLLAYCNRESTVVDPNEKETKRTNVFYGLELNDRIKVEAEIEETFQGWLAANDTWSAQIETAYLREHGSGVLREYDESPLGIARMSPSFVPGGHQNASVRRLTDQSAGIVNIAVGGGKTAVGLLTSAWWRQTGKGTRNVVVVPNNVLFNWFRECRKILPDYRIGLIGWSIDPVEGVKRQDSQDARLLKWSRFVQGDYDILLCPYSNFLNDVAMRDDTLLEMLSKVFWLERGLGIDAEDRALYERKLADLRAKLTEAEATRTSEVESKKNWEQRGWATATVDARIDKAADRVERITKDIERLEDQLKRPTASVIAEVQQDLEDLTQRKPFRPRVRPDTGWKASWDLTTLVAFSDERGILFQDGRVWLTTSYEPPLVPSKEVRGWLDALEREPTGVLLWEGTKLTKKIVTDILRVFFPKGSTESESYPRPPLVYWEDLDVDLLIVDEAHNFKNTWYAETRMGAKIEYMGSGSTADMGPQAWDMYWKCQELVARRKGGVVLLTATVLKNSPLELYNLVSMVAPDAWKSRGTRCHEEFIDRYCKLEQAMVPTSEGAFKEALSMESWRDDTKQELLRVLDQYIDRRTIGELLRRGVIRSVPLPRIIRDESDLDPIADALYDVIVNRVEKITAELKKEKDEEGAEGSTRRLIGAVTLMLLDLLRKVTIDPRLLTTHLQDVEARLREKTAKVDAGGDDPALLVQTRALLIRAALLRDDCQAHTLIERYGDTILPKYAALARRIVEMGPGCKHVLFSDFNETHGYIQDALIRLARVSPKRIAVMTGRLDPEERQAMALAYCGVPAEMDVLTGTVEERPEIPAVYDVIIGNSSVMAEGLNLQRGTCGVHHLTLPWEPATLEQRNGRAVRQGNTVEEVDVVYYLSRFSFDGIQLDKVLGKAGWMEQLYEPEVRSTGNPLAGAKFSRTEMLLLITMRKDPEGARALAMEIEERQREARLARARRNALASFETLVIEYARARRSDAEGTRRALFAAADVRAGNLRNLSDDVFSRKDLIDIARDRTVFLLFGGNYLIEGENVCFANARGDQRKFHVDSLQERSGVVVSRLFGTPVLQTTYGGLPGIMLAGEAGWGRVEDCTWDSREDYTQIMAISPRVGDLPQWDPKIITHLGLRAIWANVRREVDKGGGHYTFLPPKHAFIPLRDGQGRVHLMTPEASGRFNYGQAGALDQILPMIPQDPASWPDFLKALAQDRVDVYASRSEVRALLSRDKDRETLDNTVVLWFRVSYGPGVRSINAALRAARRARGDVDDEDSGKLRLSSRRASAAS